MRSISNLLLFCCCTAASVAYAQQTEQEQPLIKAGKEVPGSCCAAGNCCNGSQTPIGVMTDHVHPKGEWMASCMYMNMAMKGNRTGTSKTSDDTLFKQYMMAPETMTMQMHMVMLMYGITDRLTLMGMTGYATSSMSMNMPGVMMMPGMSEPSMTMQCKSSGFTDTKLSALYNFSKKESARIVGSFGVNVPTGTIRAKGLTMLGAGQRLPYDMQPGTGSVSILPDFTYVSQYKLFSFGVNAGADLKLNKNSIGYKAGNIYHTTAWASCKFLPFVSGSLRAEGLWVEKITGSDPEIAIPVYEQFDPTTSTSHYGGTWGNAYVGLNFHINKPVLKNFQLQFEYGMPVYENLNGPQMSIHSNLVAGLLCKL